MPWRECSVMDERRFYRAEGTGWGSRTPNFVALGQSANAQDDARNSHEFLGSRLYIPLGGDSAISISRLFHSNVSEQSQ